MSICLNVCLCTRWPKEGAGAPELEQGLSVVSAGNQPEASALDCESSFLYFVIKILSCSDQGVSVKSLCKVESRLVSMAFMLHIFIYFKYVNNEISPLPSHSER